MGSSKFLTIKQAAKLLEVNQRSIYRYAKRGILQARCEGRHTFVAEEDVLTMLKGKRDLLSSPLNRGVIGKLQAEVQTLKTQMAAVMRILNMKYDPFSFTVPEYEHLYRAAEQLSTTGWSPHEEEMWAEYFVRFRTEDFEKIEIAVGDKHPWRPFLRLATSMHVNPYNKDLTDMLAAGRTNIQQTAGVWCVLKEESPRTFDILQERDATPLKKLMRRMSRA
jgi:hypothetical protein